MVLYSTAKDFENIVRIMDYLERIDDGYGVVHIMDVPDHAAHAYAMLLQKSFLNSPFFK